MSDDNGPTVSMIGRVAQVFKSWLNTLKKWFLFPLIGSLIGTLLISRIIDRIIQPDAYRVYIIGNFQTAAGDISSQIRDEFVGQSHKLGQLDGVDLIIDDEQNDYGDPERARRIAKELASAGDTLMVVGHMASTQTRATLPVYLQDADPPIPVILTTETNPHLLPPSSDPDAFPVVRLAPTDDQQADSAACLALEQAGRSIAVIEAGDNPVYSKYLARKFIERAHAMRTGKVLLWLQNMYNPIIDMVHTLKVDSIFMAGDWQNALVLAHQLRSVPGPPPTLILSDACMDDRLLTLGGADLEDAYITFPLSWTRFQSEQGYRVFGADARAIVTMLIDRTNANFDHLASEGRSFTRFFNRLLGLHRIGDARNAVVNCIKEAKVTGQTFPMSDRRLLQISKKDGQLVSATGKASASENRFYIWRIRKTAGNRYTFSDVTTPICSQ